MPMRSKLCVTLTFDLLAGLSTLHTISLSLAFQLCPKFLERSKRYGVETCKNKNAVRPYDLGVCLDRGPWTTDWAQYFSMINIHAMLLTILSEDMGVQWTHCHDISELYMWLPSMTAKPCVHMYGLDCMICDLYATFTFNWGC